jgi:hypothetical protein
MKAVVDADCVYWGPIQHLYALPCSLLAHPDLNTEKSYYYILHIQDSRGEGHPIRAITKQNDGLYIIILLPSEQNNILNIIVKHNGIPLSAHFVIILTYLALQRPDDGRLLAEACRLDD